MTRFISISVLLCALLLLGGCNVVGYAANAVAGGTSTPAKFTMVKHSTVVVAENFSNPAEGDMDSEPLARYVSEDLKTNSIAPVVDPDKIYAMRSENRSKWRAMTIAAIGREAGAEQILYIDILHAGVEANPGSEMIRGHGEVRVRIVDSKTGATIWPTESADGFYLAAETPFVSHDKSTGRTESTVRAAMLRNLSNKIVGLFYTVHHD